ncbi:hypothetical protein [Enterococcus mundtii]|uniref:hypothetical protein n=1 Tax=Enterococcus mundtii TaxID=53346 RepID=UPI000E04543F|nr:hypothetical protein [Enterococcus mundtii]STE38105.1 Uncharacterised protein [Enterococcus mundtii]
MGNRYCSVKDIERNAITIRLFDKSIWANLGDGRFINPQTMNVKPISILYNNTRTVIQSGGVIYAKRPKKIDPLLQLEKPYKIKRW